MFAVVVFVSVFE